MDDEFDQSFGFLVYDIARLLRERFNDRATIYNLTLAQNRALLHLYRNEGINQSSLASMLDIQPITLVRQLDQLELKGLIERRTDSSDRRMLRLHLTPRANALIEKLMSIGRVLTDESFDGVSERDRTRVMETLQQVKSNLVRASDADSAQQEKVRD